MYNKSKFLLGLLTILFTQDALATDSLFVQQLSVHFLSKNFDDNQKKLMELIDQNGALVQNLTLDKNSYNAKHLEVEILVDQKGYETISKNLPEIGFINEQRVNRINNSEIMSELQAEVNFLNQKLQRFEAELKFTEQNGSIENREALWQKMRTLEDEIFQKQAELQKKHNQVRMNTIRVDMLEEIYTPQNSFAGGIQFVNMPGLGATYLQIENPKKGLSAKSYGGYEIKYLFTEGKSFVQFGVLKSLETRNQDSTIEEMFTYSFGQDFYPRYLGRGQRKFLNLYTGYLLGGFFATSNMESVERFFILTSVGVELIKTNYILLDSRISYFIPFYENRNLRGVMGNIAFNFVF